MDDEAGKCQDCKIPVPRLNPSRRCRECDDKFSEYVRSGWGLNALIEERNQNQALGLCFYCGSGLENPSNRLCNRCKKTTGNKQYRKGKQVTSERNPYNNVWDHKEVDNAVHLDTTYEIVAEQMLGKSKYHKYKAERGGPRGREDLENARRYIRVAYKMLEMAKEIQRKGR